MSNALSGLMAAIDKMLPREEIQGTTPRDVAKHVDLSIAYTPVLDGPVDPDRLMFDIPQPVRVQKDGMRYCLVWPGRDYRWVDIEALKEMRARFLLLRGHYYTHLGLLDHFDRDCVISWYFADGVWRPNADSELGKALGLV